MTGGNQPLPVALGTGAEGGAARFEHQENIHFIHLILIFSFISVSLTSPLFKAFKQSFFIRTIFQCK